MRVFEKEFRERYPETAGEKDLTFDNANYCQFLEETLVTLIAMIEKLAHDIRSPHEHLRPTLRPAG